MYAGTLAGIVLAALLVAMNDAQAVFDAFARVGWGLALVVLVRAAILTVCGGAWSLLQRDAWGLDPLVWVLLRWVREGINVLLPVATVGGEIIGARLLTFWGVSAGLAGAGILVDLLVQAVAQAIFALMGVALVARVEGAGAVADFALAGIGVAFVALLGFFVTLRFDGVGKLERFVVAQAAKWSSGGMGEKLAINPLRLADGLASIWRRPVLVGGSLLVHVAAWLIGVLEIWIALRWMGHPVSLADALILESIGQAVRGAAFPVPGALGVQEGGFVLLGQLLGIDPQTAIALSFVKRVPDIVLGLPALFAWHSLEGRKKNMLAPPLMRAGRLSDAD